MQRKLGLFSIFSLVILMVVPANAEVTEVSLGKNFYTVDEKISFFGSENEGSVLVNVAVKDPTGKSKLLGGFSDPVGEFETIPQSVKNIFSAIGTYNATAFVNKIENGTSILLEFDGEKVSEVPDFVLQLNEIPDKTVEVEKTVTFTASLSDSSVKDSVFSLKNEPTGATIDSSTGKFVWTPSKSHGNIQDVMYNFDVIVNSGGQEDKENVTITVRQAYVEPVKDPEKEPEPTPTEPTPTEPTPTEPNGLASFVDEAKDPQSYVDRYNTEPTYKKWFDDNYSEYSSIYEAVGLEEPKVLAPFVDPNLDPQYYIDRYNKEATYKKWFDETYPEITIYQAVGLDEPEIKKPKFGQCGEGTRLIGDVCTIFDEIEYGQCGEGTELVGKVCEIEGHTKIKQKPWWQFW
ncbi:MAG: Ig domain-containing protein [Nitrosopumilus sp.]|nr:Ig domain-containing protein [Nitrosopumilus sp.]